MRYFAYCTLLDEAEMHRFCPGAVAGAVGTIDGWRVGFARHSEAGGGCQLLPEAGHQVHGLLWELDDAEAAALDELSGVPRGLYARLDVAVTTAGGIVPAVTYIVPAPRGPFTPSPDYVRPILSGARALGLPAAYVAELEAAIRGVSAEC